MKIKILDIKVVLIFLSMLSVTLISCEEDEATIGLDNIEASDDDYANMILDVSEVVKLVVKALPTNTSEKLSWFSTNKDVLAVLSNENGRVAGIQGQSPGTAAITVKSESGDLVKTFAIEVMHKLNKLALNQLSISDDKTKINYGIIFNPDQDLTDSITTTPSTYQEIIWTSSHDAIATVSKDGVVTAVKAGVSGAAVFVTIAAYSTEFGIISKDDLKKPSKLISSAHGRIVLGNPAVFSPIIIPKYCSIEPGGAYNADAVSTTGGTTNINYAGSAPNGNYSLELNSSVSVKKGDSFKLSVTNSNGWSRTIVWVDWNLDGDFTDLGEKQAALSIEKFYSGDDPIAYSTDIVVPATSVTGDVKMRILTGDAWTYEDSKIPDEPCGELPNAGIKDFNITILE